MCSLQNCLLWSRPYRITHTLSLTLPVSICLYLSFSVATSAHALSLSLPPYVIIFSPSRLLIVCFVLPLCSLIMNIFLFSSSSPSHLSFGNSPPLLSQEVSHHKDATLAHSTTISHERCMYTALKASPPQDVYLSTIINIINQRIQLSL